MFKASGRKNTRQKPLLSANLPSSNSSGEISDGILYFLSISCSQRRVLSNGLLFQDKFVRKFSQSLTFYEKVIYEFKYLIKC